MSSLLTIVIWLGSGFAFAAGFFIGIWIVGKRNNDWSRSAEEANTLMRERNEIDRRSLGCEIRHLNRRSMLDATLSFLGLFLFVAVLDALAPRSRQ